MNEFLPLFPWIEANQGFLSLMALTLALGVAVWEHARAENATTKTARALELTADLYLFHAMQELDDVIQGQHEDPATSARNIMAFSEALKAVAPSAPVHLAIYLVKEAVALRDAADSMTLGSEDVQRRSREALAEMPKLLQRTRTEIKAYGGGAAPLFTLMRGRNARHNGF